MTPNSALSTQHSALKFQHSALKSKPSALVFVRRAAEILSLPVVHRVNTLGGYGPAGEVIYERHPDGCPSVLVATAGPAKAAFQSNGSIAFEVRDPLGMEVRVLDGHFDPAEKRETGVPSGGLWLDIGGNPRRIAALVNPRLGVNSDPVRRRVVKLGDPERAMWFGAEFRFGGAAFSTAVKFSLVETPTGPALLRELFLWNDGRRALCGNLWAFFNLRGAQRFVYNKEIWYDRGMPVGPADFVVAATVPYSDCLQIKRVASDVAGGIRPVEDTCDFTSFVGDSAAVSAMPEAVRAGRLRPGAGRRLNRFSIATITASRFAVDIPAGKTAILRQEILYVTRRPVVERFRTMSSCRFPDYPRVEKAFLAAAKVLTRATPGAARAASLAARKAPPPPAFSLEMPGEPVMTEYARSVWTGVAELYENCRAHGARLADGIELGTRDRGQDMWPKLREDPGRVRGDLVHVFSFLYVTVPPGHRFGKPLSLVEKLHGMIPRQYPSCWRDRSESVMNDNRPYADSPLWLLNALARYVRETGDVSILNETVGTVRLTDPEHPERSGIVGTDRTLTIAEAALEALECFGRHIADSPYGLAQVMYGDWCDPVDMFGTSPVGDAATRGKGRGAQVRLSCHVFECLAETADLFDCPRVAAALKIPGVGRRMAALKMLAGRLRQNILRVAWEEGNGVPAGFVACVHEFHRDGSRPNYKKGEVGYTLGSLRGTDFDGAARRDLTAQAYGLRTLLVERDWLPAVPDAPRRVRELLAATDSLLFDERLGLKLYSTAIANSPDALALVGRMGVLPAGCAENGEYHHAQVMMHRVRMTVPGEADRAWGQFKKMVSAMRDETLAGPFEMPATSYASDSADPHYGKGMYFGLSGSTDWIVDLFEAVPGVTLSLHDDRRPAVCVKPRLPASLGGRLVFRRLIHVAKPGGGYRVIPLRVEIRPEREVGESASHRVAESKSGVRNRRKGTGESILAGVTINGKRAEKAEVGKLDGLKKIDMVITVNP
ncbi:MAG: hypothetical protein V1809_01230 [Planctomycetota bacterium]